MTEEVNTPRILKVGDSGLSEVEIGRSLVGIGLSKEGIVPNCTSIIVEGILPQVDFWAFLGATALAWECDILIVDKRLVLPNSDIGGFVKCFEKGRRTPFVFISEVKRRQVSVLTPVQLNCML